MTGRQRTVVLSVGGVLVAGLILAAILFGLQGVEVMSWVAGSASLGVALVALFVTWPAADPQDRRNTVPTGDIEQHNADGVNLANSGAAGDVTLSGSPGGSSVSPAAAAPADGTAAEVPPPAPGSIRQSNTGGINIANSGTVGDVDMSQ